MPAVKALIEEEGRFLAVEMEAGPKGTIWTLPGGRVEHGEAPLEALRREVREEVSLDVDVRDPVGMFHFFFGEDDENQIVLTVFRCAPDGGAADIDSNPAEENIIAFEWVTPAEFLQREAEETLKDVIREHYTSELPKLVRNQIPDIIREDGAEPVTAQLGDGDVERFLQDKLVEEAEEFRESGELEEVADVLEVLDRIMEVEEVGGNEVERIKKEKKEIRGGFDRNILLKDVETDRG